MYRLGASNDSPNMPSMTNLCDSPIPSVSLPPASTDVLSACWASAIG